MMKKMKNNNINKTGLIIGAFCLIMVSCKAPSLTPTEKIELPEFYMDRETDSTTISSMSWKTFFPDTLLQSYIAEALNNNHSFLQNYRTDIHCPFTSSSRKKERCCPIFH